jgi:hypothetical protein
VDALTGTVNTFDQSRVNDQVSVDPRSFCGLHAGLYRRVCPDWKSPVRLIPEIGGRQMERREAN